MQPVAQAQHQSVPAGEPVYWPASGGTLRARYVRISSIGNEIRNGILWPVGQVDWTADTGWSNLTTLLKAGVAGARAGRIPGVGWELGAGSPNDNLTLFSFTGQALPSVGLFQSPLAVCAHYDPWALPCEVPGGGS